MPLFFLGTWNRRKPSNFESLLTDLKVKLMLLYDCYSLKTIFFNRALYNLLAVSKLPYNTRSTCDAETLMQSEETSQDQGRIIGFLHSMF